MGGEDPELAKSHSHQSPRCEGPSLTCSFSSRCPQARGEPQGAQTEGLCSQEGRLARHRLGQLALGDASRCTLPSSVLTQGLSERLLFRLLITR